MVEYLQEKGVQLAGRAAKGHGQHQPLAGRQKNRRVELKILRQAN